MTRLSRGIGLLGIVLLLDLPALAQSPAEEPLQNVQVFPAGTTRTQLLNTMNAMNESLGVQCVYCHVAGAQGERPDFVSDENPKKDIARRMMRFRDEILGHSRPLFYLPSRRPDSPTDLRDRL
jgi:hypothetical protein